MDEQNNNFNGQDNISSDINNNSTDPIQNEDFEQNTDSAQERTYAHSFSQGTHYYTSNPDVITKTDTEEKKKSVARKNLAVILICSVICIALCIGAFALGSYRSKSKKDDDKHPVIGTSTEQNYDETENSEYTDKSEETDSDVTLSYSSSEPTSAMNTIEVASKTVNSVVEISTEAVQTSSFFGQYITEGAGSGVIISEDGFIATNYHVIEGATKITVTLRSGESFSGNLWGYNIQNDLAVVKIETNGLSPATFGNSDNLMVAEEVLAIGNPLGQLGGSVAHGYIAALQRQISIDNTTMTLLQVDASFNPGNSGGGLFNGKSELIGIVNAKSTGENVEGIGYAIPSNVAYPILQDIIENRSTTKKATLGVTIAYDNYMGVYISEVVSGSDAERAGLEKGDILLYIDDTRITSTSQCISLVQSHYVGDTVSIVVYRNRVTQTIQVTFTDSESSN